MSSRRKSTTPCMVLPSIVVAQEELDEKTERTKKEEEVERDEGKMKKGAEEGPSAEDLEQAVVVVPTPPDTDEPTISTAEDNEVPGPSVKGSSSNLAEDPNSNQSNPEPQSDAAEEGGADTVSVAAISLSKTPIMRMKTKSEPKRIAVSLKSTEEAADSLGGGGGGGGSSSAVGGGGGGEGDVGGEQEPIEAPLGPMTPVEMLLHDSMKLGGGGLHVSPSSEQQRKSSILNPTVLPTSLAQVEMLRVDGICILN